MLLGPQSDEASSFATLTEMSDASSLLGDVTPATSATDLLQLEQLSNELANKGPKQSEVELRYG